MDSKLYNGDHIPSGNGFVAVEGDRELLQRALIRLAVRKGRFTPDPMLGSELFKLRTCNRSDLDRQAVLLGNDALRPMGLAVSSVNVQVDGDCLRLFYSIRGLDDGITVEIE